MPSVKRIMHGHLQAHLASKILILSIRFLRMPKKRSIRQLAGTLLLLLVALLFSFDDVTAQTTKVSGKVYDVATNEPLPFVNINFKGSKIGTITDIDGNYTIDTYYATDSLRATFVGYKPLAFKVKRDRESVIDFPMQAGSIELNEITIKYEKTENPAHAIIRNVIRNKKINNREKLAAYEYEVYNKVEFDINNINEEFKERRVMRPFDFIFEHIDSSEQKPFLPIFITEALSHYHYRKNPKAQKEIVSAARVSGVENESVSQFLGDMYQNMNIYDNYINAFGKSFISPISDFGRASYRYYLTDSSLVNDRYWCYKIKFTPKRKHELTFDGEMWIHDTTYAVKEVYADISGDANINWINEFRVHQEYDQVAHEVWMLTNDQLVIDFFVSNKTVGFYGRKTSSYKDFVINQPRDDDFFKGPTNIVIADSAREKSEEFWTGARHDTLTENEQLIYHLVDTIKDVPAFRTYVDIIQLVISGYYVRGNFEFGPYFTTYSFNQVEGSRFRVGGRTSNDFSKRLELKGYLAYGIRDEEFKYGGAFRWFVKKSKKPRIMVGAQYEKDIQQLGQGDNALQEDNILSSVFRRNPALKLNGYEVANAWFDWEPFPGFSTRVTTKYERLWPLGSLSFTHTDAEGVTSPVGNIATTEVSLLTRFAYKEKYVAGEFDRISLGTDYPVVAARYAYGIPNVLNGDYEYHKLAVSISDKLKLDPFGYSDIVVEGGKIWGTLPYPLLELHNGNETYSYDETAFNLMNFFEFVSDEYVSGSITHHFNGLFLNKIPLMQKLKWREVASAKGVWGRLNDKSKSELDFPSTLHTLGAKPYYEAGVGIENILKVLRIDVLWRGSYLDNPGIAKWGIRGMFVFQF